MAALQEAIGKVVAWILGVQVSFNFVQVWGGGFIKAKTLRARRRKGTGGKVAFTARQNRNGREYSQKYCGEKYVAGKLTTGRFQLRKRNHFWRFPPSVGLITYIKLIRICFLP